MQLPRRRPPVDPTAAARLAAVLGVGGGWVPPPTGPVATPPSAARRTAPPVPAATPPPGAPPTAAPAPPAVAHAATPASLEAAPAQGAPRRRAGRPARRRGRHAAEPPVAVGRDAAAPSSRRARGPAPRPGGAALSTRWRQGRLDPGLHGVAALGLLALLVAVLAAVLVLRARPHAVAAPAVATPSVLASGRPVPGSAGSPGAPGARTSTRVATAAPSGAPGPAATPAALVVAVAGKVARPGLVRLAPGSRVDDAVRAAGGALAVTDLGQLNLARPVADGEQVLVGVPAPTSVPTPGGTAAPAPAGAGRAAPAVDLNTATVGELDSLPGIGPVLAQKIVDWRGEHGRFDSVDQLREVSGIGESKYGELVARVRV